MKPLTLKLRDVDRFHRNDELDRIVRRSHSLFIANRILKPPRSRMNTHIRPPSSLNLWNLSRHEISHFRLVPAYSKSVSSGRLRLFCCDGRFFLPTVGW
jgi:hypothetical protein